MDTIINPIEHDYDLDDGVYFLGGQSKNERAPVQNFHDFVFQAVKADNPHVYDVKDKDTCVRALYKEGYRYQLNEQQMEFDRGFHVDMPIYYSDTIKCPDLAHLKKGWTVSDPIEFIEWFENKVNSKFDPLFLYERARYQDAYREWREQIYNEDKQVRRIVRYLKAWCDFIDDDMPCGIILTILGANSYVGRNTDDVALRDTLISMKATLDAAFECRRPTTPKGEDILAGYDKKATFMSHLQNFMNAAIQAVNEPNQKRACGKWQTQFGDRFSCLNAFDYDPNARTASTPAIITDNAKSS
ncbi:MAG: hypothetical protein JST70_13935 [Bacteroidetes bacterium]|nr:hypothetical protein [Bacteroidota bacterium]